MNGGGGLDSHREVVVVEIRIDEVDDLLNVILVLKVEIAKFSVQPNCPDLQERCVPLMQFWEDVLHHRRFHHPSQLLILANMFLQMPNGEKNGFLDPPVWILLLQVLVQVA